MELLKLKNKFILQKSFKRVARHGAKEQWGNTNILITYIKIWKISINSSEERISNHVGDHESGNEELFEITKNLYFAL